MGKYIIIEIFKLKRSSVKTKIPSLSLLGNAYLTNRVFNHMTSKLPQYSLKQFFFYLQIKFNRNNIDFIRVNGISAKRQTMKRCPSVNALDELKKKEEEEYNKHRKGEVPK